MAIRAIPDIPWGVNVRHIGPMKINVRTNRSYWLRDPVEGEKFILGAMQRLVRPGDIVFDVGANIGLHVRFLVQQFGAGKVIAFEPAPSNIKLLKQNIQLGNCENSTQILPIALADFDGEDEFQVDNISSATGSLNIITCGEPSQARKQYGFSALTERVTVAQCDTLMARGDIPIPSVIKVDVEGAEERFLRGSLITLKKFAPNLVIELHGAEAAKAVVRLLQDVGYHIFGYLTSRCGTSKYKDIKAADISEIRDQYSLLCCVAGRDPKVLETHTDY
jgi:FkbM family methyltransferase